MYTIIGLGSAGCNVAELFENGNYKVKLIDVDIEGENCFSLKPQKSPEDYEKNAPDLSSFFSDITDKVLLVVGGSGKISGASLQILKQIKHSELNLIYIRPDTQLLGNTARMQDRLTFNVFQEYARSGIFKSIILISNSVIENLVGDVSIIDYNNTLNKVIYNAVDNYLGMSEKEAIIDNSTHPKDVSRIITVGVYDIEKNIEQLFYPFDFIDDKCYYFAINENELKSNGKLFKLIKDRMREKVVDKTKISYRIHSTKHEQNYCFVVAYSKKIQE